MNFIINTSRLKFPIIVLTFIIISQLFFQSKKKTPSTLNANEKQEIIDVHNQWRTEVGVDSIKWSEELATIAQSWANRLAKKGCRMKHSSTNYGENIYWSSFESTPKQVVNAWGTEKKYYHRKKIKESQVHKYGHYTQMVWSTTTFVGCGRAKCKNGQEIWVCNYAPAGNIIGEVAYK